MLQVFNKAIGPLISNSTHMKDMVSAMNMVLSASTLPVKVKHANVTSLTIKISETPW